MRMNPIETGNATVEKYSAEISKKSLNEILPNLAPVSLKRLEISRSNPRSYELFFQKMIQIISQIVI